MKIGEESSTMHLGWGRTVGSHNLPTYRLSRSSGVKSFSDKIRIERKNSSREVDCNYERLTDQKLLVLLVMVQLPQILIGVHQQDPRTADFRSSQQHLIDFGKLGRLRHAVLDGIRVDFDSEGKVDLIEADICAFVLTSGSFAKGKEGPLSHCRQHVHGHVTLRPCADSPRTFWMILLE